MFILILKHLAGQETGFILVLKNFKKQVFTPLIYRWMGFNIHPTFKYK